MSKIKSPGRRAMAKLCAGRRIDSDEWDRIPRRDRRHHTQMPAIAVHARGKRHAKQLPGIWRKRAEAKANKNATTVVYKFPTFKESA